MVLEAVGIKHSMESLLAQKTRKPVTEVVGEFLLFFRPEGGAVDLGRADECPHFLIYRRV
jgi:hypothetical protein